MRYDTRLGKYDGKPRPGGPRSTLCVSSQVWDAYMLFKYVGTYFKYWVHWTIMPT